MIRRILTFFIFIYQRYISSITAPQCRFYPTCSNYALEAIQTKPLHIGIWLVVKRICKCHPFHPGGYDPVP